MKYLQETTADWKAEYRVPCHTYMLNDGDKAIGYIKEGTTKEIMFSKPHTFERKGRKFKTINR